MNFTLNRRSVVAGLAMAGLSAAFPAAAQDIHYPVDNVTLVTLSSPGGGTDVFLRELIPYLQPVFGANFIVQNVAGGGGAKAMAFVAKAPKDGSVLLGTTGTLVNTSVTSKVEYSTKDMDWVLNLFEDPSLIFVKADSPIQTLKDMIEYAKANPGKLKYGIATPTSLDRLAVEQFQALEKVKINAVPFDGGGDLTISVLNGTLDVGGGEVQSLAPLLAGGKIKIIATLTDQRVPVLPDVPTAKEQGYPVTLVKFRGLSGPKNLPPEVLQAWDQGFQKLLDDPAFKKWYEAAGLMPAKLNHEQYEAFIADYTKTQEKFFRDIGVIN